MSEITVANGWKNILAEAIEEASKLPEEWLFEIVSAERIDGGLKLSATYNSFDVPIDDYLPPERKLPHPFRSEMRIREAARAKSLRTCECCGREGQLVGAGQDARVRCLQHEYVVDAGEGSANPIGFMFESAEEAMAHFLRDYGDGIDMMQGLRAAADESSTERDLETKH
ncbi:hypothetical protein E0H68_29190 [Rhizobium leguminosarum bv. viciae]|uniref:hypothetical protein n=1 Tax=Rhizobium leguminosarum TaxID=384 RepID=UPI00103C2425|nr:hypothetical protein [Rhizobium leguminosarum]TCA07749.1 hypothetical protein E0H68_29190 [Rhizobium leguminosarum bv. viciae]